MGRQSFDIPGREIVKRRCDNDGERTSLLTGHRDPKKYVTFVVATDAQIDDMNTKIFIIVRSIFCVKSLCNYMR